MLLLIIIFHFDFIRSIDFFNFSDGNYSVYITR